MKIFLLSILVLLFITSTAYPQVKQQWVQTTPSPGSGFKDIQLDAAGNVYMLGSSSDSSFTSWTQLASYTPSGEQRFCILNNTGMNISDWFFDTPGNIYIGGYYTANSGTCYTHLFKYNSSGELQWETSDSIYNKGMLKGFAGDLWGNSYLLKYERGKNTILMYNPNGIYVRSIYVDETFSTNTIAVDSLRNIYISGLRYNEQTNSCITIKYDSHGIRQWLAEYNPEPGVINTNKLDVKVNSGNVYIMMAVTYKFTGSDYLLLKYDRDGMIQWTSQYNRSDNDEPSDFVIDSKSNVIVTGNNGTVKFNRKGLNVWSDSTKDMVSAASDKLNNIYLTGTYYYTFGATYADMVTVKLNADGNKMWSLFYKEADPYSYEEGKAITVDTSFNVYACGYKINPAFSYSSGAIVKYTQHYIDTTSLRFMPISIGNTWMYKVTSNNISNYIRSVVTKDTIAEGKRYYYITNFPISGYSNWLRTDTVTGNLFAYIPQYSCSYSAHERIVDSLSAKESDTLRDCISTTEFKTCIDTGLTSLWSRVTSFKQFQNNTQNKIWCYAKDMGIYSIYNNDVNPTTYTLKGCLVNGKVYGDTTMRYSITGTVRFKDSREPVTSGKVKALKYIYSTGKIAVIDSAVITATGIFRLENVTVDSSDIMAYQDDEELDYPPGFHDSTIYWQSSATLVAGANTHNIDIYVERIIRETGTYHISGHVFALNSGFSSPPLENCRIYVKSESLYRSFNITDVNGGYSIDSIPKGVYTFIIDRLGYYPQERQVDLTGYSKDTVDFYLLKFAGIERDFSSIPTKYTLIQNYPNPFNPSTTFVFDLPSSSDVSLTIYDITGREVSRLMDKKLNAGRYKISWDASELASGIYFYRLEARSANSGSGYIETKKLVLMK
ncbi:MAG: T9SS C-terminal target domain-containing protein [Ignavibacteriae bacterium]|nr:MAG: T9SS C-terminal target domain-containing protein [Ignavibacteriota bacterium]